MRLARGYRGLLPLLPLILLSCAAQRTPTTLRGTDEQKLADVDAELAALRPVLRGYPPRVSSKEQRQQVTAQWKETEAALNELAGADPQDPKIQWRLGELYRFGHNLDIPQAGAACIRHLERAIALRPDYVDAYLELGIFYTDAGPQWAQLGEANLKKAIKLSAPTPLPRGWRALAFAYYYQGRFSDSAAAADKYLSLVPDDSDLQQMKLLAQQAASRGSRGLAPAGRLVIP